MSSVPILLYLCPHTTMYLASPYYYICVLILLYMCPHTTIYVSSYYYISSVSILLYVSSYYYAPPTAPAPSSACNPPFSPSTPPPPTLARDRLLLSLASRASIHACASSCSRSSARSGHVSEDEEVQLSRLLRQYLYSCTSKASKLST
jgi:hypothetical protein